MDSRHTLELLRKALEKHALAAFLQPVNDEYMNEYPPASARRVEWLCGFSGSAGTAAVARGKAAFFTDGRYTLQARAQIDGTLFEQHNISDLLPEAWLAATLESGGRVGYDAKLHSAASIRRMEAALGKKNIALVASPNLVDEVWKERPPAPASQLFVHEMQYSGEASASKRQRVAAAIKSAGADAALIAAPDAVCWLFNVRAHDVENAPLALATALVDKEGKAQLFILPSRVSPEVRTHLGGDISVAAPDTLEAALSALGKARQRVLVDPQSAPAWFTQVLAGSGAMVVEGQDPCMLPKAMKNAAELSGMKAAHLRDGLAVTKLLCWLDNEIAKREVTELEVADKLLSFRSAHGMFREASFSTIAGSGPNGAIVHYRATPETNRALKKGELFLLDSGGQYPDGTTDITRTVAVGEPSMEQRDRFTRVLKGHIAIATARFPDGTAGSSLDALARQYLWAAGLDYDHGTGHGVGCFLNVHEGPQRISKRGGDAALKAGMIISNEPGYYKAGEYGIRIENLVAVVKQEAGEGGRDYFGFETITCAPIDTRLIDGALLTAGEKKWLNDYHAWVLESHSALLEADDRRWLAARCAVV